MTSTEIIPASDASTVGPATNGPTPTPDVLPTSTTPGTNMSTSVTTTTTIVPGCLPENNFNFSQVKINNLGGLGPDFGEPEVLLFGDVFPHSGYHLDLEVTHAAGDYITKKPENNGCTDGFLTINVRSDSDHPHFLMRFKDPQTGQPAAFDSKFAITVLDIDSYSNGAEEVYIESAAISDYFLTEDSAINVTEQGTRLRFRATEIGDSDDNPGPGYEYTPKQMRMAVFLDFDPTDQFNVILNIDRIDGKQHRNFYLTGETWLHC